MELIFFLILLFSAIIGLAYGHEKYNPAVFYFGALMLIISGMFLSGYGLDKQSGFTQNCNGVGCSLNDTNSITTSYEYETLSVANNQFVWGLSLLLPGIGLIAALYYIIMSLYTKREIGDYRESDD